MILSPGEVQERRKSIAESLEEHDAFMLEIRLEKAFKLKAMDKNGFSDPFVNFSMGGKKLCASDTKKKNLNPVWNQNFAVKIPAEKGKLLIEVFDHDVIGSNDLIGCNSLDLGPLVLEESVRKVLKLRESLTKPENDKLGSVQFTVRVAPFDESGQW